MSRVINFRAWDKVHKKMGMVEQLNFYVDKENRTALLNHPTQCHVIRHFSGEGYSAYAGQDFVIMQDTGLKDKNTEPIYEGDIVESPHSLGPVEYAGAAYYVKWLGNQGRSEKFNERLDTWETDFNIEVIGNIYENPELLEEQP